MIRDSAARPSRSARRHAPHEQDTARRPRRSRPDVRDDPSAPERSVPQGLPPERQKSSAGASVQHREDALFYAPPYVTGRGDALRTLADRLAARFVEHLDPSRGLRGDQVVLTPYNCFRLDLLIEAEGTADRTENSGAEGGGPRGDGSARAGVLLGERPEAKGAPALYDALIVGSGAVDVLYRFAPEGLAAHLDDALALMHQRDPALFEHDERLRASKGRCSGALHGPETRLSYPAPPVEVTPGRPPERPEAPPDLVMRRLDAAAPASWAEEYRRALDHFRVPASQHRSLETLRRRAA